MIYTVTLSPALDYQVRLSDNFKENEINRSIQENYQVGGKGINVSILLNNLNTKSIALGFVGGFVGEFVKSSLNDLNIEHKFVGVNGITRINVKINDKDSESAINANGPVISEDNLRSLYDMLLNLKDDDILVLSGNIPSSISNTIYENIFKLVSNKKIKVFLDTTKNYLLSCLKYNPFLIKPNLDELEEIFGTKLKSNEEIVEKASQLINLGARNVLVSLGVKGAILVTNDKKVYHEHTYKGNVENTVGAGDSMLAGFIYEYDKSRDFQSALSFSIACGAATAFNKGIATKNEIEKLIKGGKKWE